MSAAAASPPGPSRDEEITAFFRGYYNPLVGYLVKACQCPPNEAEDVAQDSFLAVRGRWEHVRTLEKPAAYLYKVAGRRWGRLQRERAGKPDLVGGSRDLSAEFPDPQDAFAAADRRDTALGLLRQLPPRQRQVVWLRAAAGFSEAETASILSISAGTVKSQLHDGKARLEELAGKARGSEFRPGPW